MVFVKMFLWVFVLYFECGGMIIYVMLFLLVMIVLIEKRFNSCLDCCKIGIITISQCDLGKPKLLHFGAPLWFFQTHCESKHTLRWRNKYGFGFPIITHLHNHESRLLNWMKLYFKEDLLKLCLLYIQWLRFLACGNVWFFQL